MKARSFIGWSALASRDLFGTFGRLTSLLFDEVYCHVPQKDVLAVVLERSVEDGTVERSAATEIGRIWKPVHDVIPEYRFLGSNPWGNTTPGLVSAAERIVTEATLRDDPELGRPGERAGLQHEVLWAAGGLIETVSLWAALNGSDSYSFVANDREIEVVREVFGNANPGPHIDLFGDVMSAIVPDVSDLSWGRILELRQNPYLESFRRKMAELQNTVRRDDQTTIREIVQEMERRDLRELARVTRPAAASSLFKAVVSNLPLPIPINPASIGLSVLDAIQAYQRRQRYGWIYFVLELNASDTALALHKGMNP